MNITVNLKRVNDMILLEGMMKEQEQNKDIKEVKPNSFLDRVICFFRGHKWDNIGNYEPPAGGEGVTTCYSSLHKCERCGKEEMKGMGCITW